MENDLYEVQKIENKMLALNQKRRKILEELGVSEEYFVINGNNHIDRNTWVLTPEADYEVLLQIAETLPSIEKNAFLGWLKEYRENSCITICPVCETPRCCYCCDEASECEEILFRCLNYRQDCERRGNYEIRESREMGLVNGSDSRSEEKEAGK